MDTDRVFWMPSRCCWGGGGGGSELKFTACQVYMPDALNYIFLHSSTSSKLFIEDLKQACPTLSK